MEISALNNISKFSQITLPIMESFYTIQGEGYYQGESAYFIRLGGCDIGCIWCDVKESWEASNHPVLNISDLLNKIEDVPADIVVITGGEPFMYDLSVLTKLIHAKGKKCHVETSGVYDFTGKWDWICLSPKKFQAPQERNMKFANELKVIVYNKSDFIWAELYASKVKDSCQLYLQPEWDKRDEMMPHIIKYVKEHPNWKISLQIHKYMNIP